MVNENKNVSTGEDQVNRKKTWCCLEGENLEDHKFIRAKTWVTKT